LAPKNTWFPRRRSSPIGAGVARVSHANASAFKRFDLMTARAYANRRARSRDPMKLTLQSCLASLFFWRMRAFAGESVFHFAYDLYPVAGNFMEWFAAPPGVAASSDARTRGATVAKRHGPTR
jgi:hypothetical protein